MENSVQEFVSEESNADYAAIVNRFGPAEKIAESFVLEMDATELVQGIHIRYRVMLIIVSAVALLSAVRLAFLAAAYFNHERDMNGYAIVDIVEIERIEITEGDGIE